MESINTDIERTQYINPDAIMEGLQKLAPFSKSEMELISKRMLEPQFLCYDTHNTYLNVTDKGCWLDADDIKRLTNFFQKHVEDGTEKMYLEITDFDYDDDKQELIFGAKTNTDKIDARYIKEIGSNIANTRASVLFYENKTKEMKKINDKMSDLVTMLQERKITRAQFTDKTNVLRQEKEKLDKSYPKH